MQLIRNNTPVLLGMSAGLVLGCLHWYYFGLGWGTYPLSSELWVNAGYGAIAGGFVMSFFQK